MKRHRTLLRGGLILAATLPLVFAPPAIGHAREHASEVRVASTASFGPSGSVAQAAGAGSLDATGRQSSRGVPPAGSPVAQPSLAGGSDVELAPDGRPARAGSVIVTFKPSASASSRDAALRQSQAVASEPVGNGGAVRVQVQPGRLGQALAAYATRSDVARVEPDYLVRASMTPNDPKYPETWGVAKVGAPQAWDRVGGAANIRIAILDSGVVNHPDLAARLVLQRDFSGSTSGPTDVHGHGTHVAGTAVATANNGIGAAGIAHNAQLLNAKVLGDAGTGAISSVANGIIWAADNGAHVISMSLGADFACPTVLQDAANYAWSRGAVVVAAAGNDGQSRAHAPANCANVIAVGASDRDDSRPSFSNYGAQVPISAPGTMILSTAKDGSYGWMSGTSAATPHVAGVLGLIWASSYGANNQTVVSRLYSSADRIAGTGSSWVYGRANAAAAVDAGGAPSPAPAPSPTPAPAPVPTAPPPACSPRPPVQVDIARTAPGTLTVTVTAGGTASSNSLQQVRFGAATNALIAAGDRPAASGDFVVNLSSAPQRYTFTVQRATSGGATTVPLTVVDSCGEWPTFVGGGPGAF